MEKRISRKDLWDGAGKAGLVLGLVSSAYVIINFLLSKLTGSFTSLPLLSNSDPLRWALNLFIQFQPRALI